MTYKISVKVMALSLTMVKIFIKNIGGIIRDIKVVKTLSLILRNSLNGKVRTK